MHKESEKRMKKFDYESEIGDLLVKKQGRKLQEKHYREKGLLPKKLKPDMQELKEEVKEAILNENPGISESVANKEAEQIIKTQEKELEGSGYRRRAGAGYRRKRHY